MAYRRAINESVSIEDVKDIARKLVEMAKAGNEKAAKVILERVAGKVIQEVSLAVAPIKLYNIGKEAEEAV